MYEKFYGLREKPFALTPDPEFLYFGRHHKRALRRIAQVVHRTPGFFPG